MRRFLLPLIFIGHLATAQDFTDQLFADFDKVREPTLKVQRIKHAQLVPLIERLAANPDFTVREVGQSIEGRSLSLISIGTGDTDVFLWSQMHGNEPTATMAVFDMLNMLADPDMYKAEKTSMLENVTLHFLPMLNPDGAERFTRRNLLGVDINRDAQRLQTPEGRTLKYVRDSLDAEFGFNLHDQSRYYNANRTDKPATISYLAPAYNYEKEINNVRGNAMKVIVMMNEILQRYVPGQVGRYNDAFEPRAFGDNIQKWGTSAILIESGGHYDDPEKQFIRKLNYMSIASAIFSIADGSYADVDISRYEEIPNNDRKLFDLKIEGATYELKGKDYVLDIGIHRFEVDDETNSTYHYVGRVTELGDLSTYYGYQTIDAAGLQVEAAATTALDQVPTDFRKLLEKGTAYVTGIASDAKSFSSYPVHLANSDQGEEYDLSLGANATFLLKDGDEIKYVIVNGFLYDPAKDNYGIPNTTIMK